MCKRIDKMLLMLLFFFSTVFTTTFIGPSFLKLSPVRIVIIIILILFIYRIVKNGKIIISKSGSPFIAYFFASWIVYAIVLSVIMSKDFMLSFNSIIYLLIGLVLYLYFLDCSLDYEVIWTCLKVMVVGIAINNIIAWYELFTNNYLFSLSKENAELFTRHGYAVTFFANPNNFCTLLSIGVFICLGLFSYADKLIPKVLYLGVAVSSILIMVANVSESNIIGVVIGVVLLLLLNLYKKNSLKKWHLLLFALILLIFIFNIERIITFVLSYVNITVNTFGVADSTIGARLNFAKNAISGMLDNSFLGVGAGNSIYYTLSSGGIGNVHNWFIEILVDYGPIICLLYILLYIKQIFQFKKAVIREKCNEKYLYQICFGVLTSFLISNISSSTLFTYEYMWVTWSMIYYIYQLAIMKEKRRLHHE